MATQISDGVTGLSGVQQKQKGVFQRWAGVRATQSVAKKRKVHEAILPYICRRPPVELETRSKALLAKYHAEFRPPRRCAEIDTPHDGPRVVVCTGVECHLHTTVCTVVELQSIIRRRTSCYMTPFVLYSVV